jgi:hypothetical protein
MKYVTSEGLFDGRCISVVFLYRFHLYLTLFVVCYAYSMLTLLFYFTSFSTFNMDYGILACTYTIRRNGSVV